LIILFYAIYGLVFVFREASVFLEEEYKFLDNYYFKVVFEKCKTRALVFFHFI